MRIKSITGFWGRSLGTFIVLLVPLSAVCSLDGQEQSPHHPDPVVADSESSILNQLSDEQLIQALKRAAAGYGPDPTPEGEGSQADQADSQPIHLQGLYQNLQVHDGDQIRQAFLGSLPDASRATFSPSPYGWGSWLFDTLKGEALSAGAALSLMALASYGKGALFSLLGQYGGGGCSSMVYWLPILVSML